MTSVLATALLTALVLAVPATLALFVGRPRTPRTPLSVRVPATVIGVGLASLGVGAVLGAGPTRAVSVAVVLAATCGAGASVLRSWTVRGLVAWTMTLAAGAAYLAYVLVWLLQADLSLAATVGGWALWLLEGFVYLLALGYLWEMVDVLARWSWRRSSDLGREVALAAERLAAGEPVAAHAPFVSLHVPTHNEPPDLVISTLTSLLALEYPAYEVLVLDNNTEDAALWEPVRAFCEQHPVLRFVHLADWPGYKSGALNHGLAITDPRAEVIGIVDADYQVDPDFLAVCAPLFADERLAFLQTPQDYRDADHDPYFRRLYLSYSYFFDVSQRSRNERDGAIFGGTMGLIRRRALQEVGGWDEWCITEDAELSLRLLRAGWSGTHVDRSFGRGLMPLTFEALKRQRFRWCFGGIQILRLHARSLLPGPRTEANRLSLGQRWAYLVGGLQWFGDAAGLLFTTFLLVGAVDLATGDGLVVRRFSGPLLISVLGLVLLAWLRSLALLRRSGGASWRDSIGALSIWLGLGWVVALASLRGLVAREGAFLRTPKTRGEVTWRDALRGNRIETLLALVTGAGALLALAALASQPLAAAVVTLLLGVQAAGFAAAPANSLAAIRADLTPEQRRRRREGLLSWTRSPGVRRAGLGPLVGGALAVLTLTVFAAPVGAPLIDRVPGAVTGPRPEPARTTPRERASTAPSGSTSGSAGAVTPSAAGTTGRAQPVGVVTGTSSGAAVGAASSAAATPGAGAASGPTRTPTALPSSAPPTTAAPSATPTRSTGQPTSKPTQAASPTTRPTTRPTQRATPTKGPSRTPRP